MSLNNEVFLNMVEADLQKCCDEYFYTESQVSSAAKYSLLNAGKRVRAMLIFLTGKMCGQAEANLTRLASAVEMVHCYSLIHDDLPCMDNDDFRRGKPSCHKANGEAVALLAGDALIGCSFEAIANMSGFSSDSKIRAIQMFGKAIGPKGMIYGQELDLKFEDIKANKEQLNEIHKNKTGCLISLCGQLGSLDVDLKENQKAAIRLFFDNVGLVFQIIDDVLDVEGNEKELGKPTGSDGANNKSTFVSLYGLEKSKDIACKLTMQANNALTDAFGEKSSELIEYTSYLLNRKN